jgi:hypothetical protein
MKKQERYFQKIAEYKKRFRHFSTEKIKSRLLNDYLYKEAAIALRELLEERQQSLCEQKLFERFNYLQSQDKLEI